MVASFVAAFLSTSKILRRHVLTYPLVFAVGVVLAAGLSARQAAAATVVTVTWNSNIEADVTGYVVSWGVASGVYTNAIDVGNQISLPFTPPDPTVPYYFVVQAYNTNKVSSAYSAEAATVPIVVVRLPVAVTGVASAITATGAMLNGTANPQGAATTGSFSYGPAASYGSTTLLMNVGWGTQPVSIGNGTVTGLTCLTVYHYRATATNSVGTASGTDSTFSTSACANAPASPSGTRVPSASSITDSSQAVWTLGSGLQILRNGVPAADGHGSQILWFQGTIYALGTNAIWYRWAGSDWMNNGATDPSGTPTASPSGTRVPVASSITDSSQAVWTLGSGLQILRNGVPAADGHGSQILWFQGTIYALGTNAIWYRWAGSDWMTNGTTDPSGTPTTVSPSGTRVPAASSITDNSLAVWTIASGNLIYRNGVSAADGHGTQILWFQGTIYVPGTNAVWYRWTGSDWTANGTTDPSGTPTTVSPSGTRVPAASSITDSSLAVWTIASGNLIYRNGVSAADGHGTQILWFQGTIYVPGTNAVWYKWTGSDWTANGTTDPSATPTASPSGTKVPTASSITDSSLAVWTIASGNLIFRNGVSAADGHGTQILWLQSTIYVLGTNALWYRWTGSDWTFFSASAPV